MRIPESIRELKYICQYSREKDYSKRAWPERYIQRPISIYLTKLFLIIGISANQASLIGFIIAVIGGVFLTFAHPAYWLIGIALLFIFMVIVTVDGEIARYDKISSPKGAFCNSMPEQFIWIYMPICISFGIYNMVHNIYPFILGYLGILSISMSTSAQLLPYPLLRDKGLLSEAIRRANNSEESTTTVIKYGRFLNHTVIVLIMFFLCTMVDLLCQPPLTVGSLSFNARYICFIGYTLVWLASAIRNIYLPLRKGIKLTL